MGPESLNSMSSLGASDAKSKPTVRQSRSLSPLTRNTAARPASRPACRTRLSSTSPNVAASSSVRTASGRRAACTARSSLQAKRLAHLLQFRARSVGIPTRCFDVPQCCLDVLTRRVELLPRRLELTSRGVGLFASGIGSLSGGFGLASCRVGVAAGRFDLEPVLLDAAFVLLDQTLTFVARSRSDDAAGLRSRLRAARAPRRHELPTRASRRSTRSSATCRSASRRTSAVALSAASAACASRLLSRADQLVLARAEL